MKTTKLNLYAGNENAMRAYEIAKCGNHNMLLLTNKIENGGVDKAQLNLLRNYFNSYFDPNKPVDIYIEVVRPDFNTLARNYKGEMDQINERIKAFKENPPIITHACIGVNNSIDNLIKVAYDRLGLCPYEIQIILDVATTIAKIDKAKEVKVEHIAEAIQYRSVEKEVLTYEVNK